MGKNINRIIKAFYEGKTAKNGHDRTENYQLFYRNNKIAEKGVDGLYINTCNWNSRTTRDRLNMLPNVWVRCRKGNLQINFTNDQSKWQDWDGQWINVEK